MKLLAVLSLLIAWNIGYSQEHLNQEVTEKLKWLEGTWERQGLKQGTSAIEYWLFENNKIHGKGISLQGTDTSFVEGLSIQVKESKVYYVADVPGNNAPTYFEIKTISKTGFISENLRHDFPKRIQYELAHDFLTVVISDAANKKMTFQFKKASD